MSTPEVTILIPNFRTPEITTICFRLLRKYTPPSRAHVIAIDNDSRDESVAYLRRLKWIELIERTTEPGETPPTGPWARPGPWTRPGSNAFRPHPAQRHLHPLAQVARHPSGPVRAR